jgi:hypothetical protein
LCKRVERKQEIDISILKAGYVAHAGGSAAQKHTARASFQENNGDIFRGCAVLCLSHCPGGRWAERRWGITYRRRPIERKSNAHEHIGVHGKPDDGRPVVCVGGNEVRGVAGDAESDRTREAGNRSSAMTCIGLRVAVK